MDCSAFTIELCVRIDLAPTLQRALLSLVSNLPEVESRDDAWERQATIANLLLANLRNAERGCWEFWPEPPAAAETYADWARPVTSHVVPETTQWGPYDSEPRSLSFTMVYLLAAGSASERMMREACDADEARLWQREQFAKILTAVKSISFASVRSYALYLAPRDTDRGFSAHDLANEKFRYLRFLTPPL